MSETGSPHARAAPEGAYDLRPATERDRPAILAVAAAALGWREGEPNEALFRWKHLDNPFGPSPSWVATHEGRVVGFRTFMRWRFDSPDGSRRAVRAVDTATDPGHQRRGLFRALTLGALEDLRGEGVDFVFNTPNASSRPGYLSMGWEVIGHVPVAVSVPRWRRAPRVVRARTAAEKWSEPVTTGEAAPDVLADTTAIEGLLASQPPTPGLRTARDPAFLAWRYGLAPLGYRAVLRTSRPEDGLALLRVRRRGAALEGTLADLLVPDASPAAATELLARVRAALDVDYLLRVGGGGNRFVPVPRLGPVLTWRAVRQLVPPPLAAWDLVLGDVELF